MIVSWDWLQSYVPLKMSLEELTDRLTMTGLNLEGVEAVKGDTAIDLEVTSNRADCLGHVGVAREISVLFQEPLTIPPAEVTESSTKTSSVTQVDIECEDLCPQYIARVIRGVNVGPSPEWLRTRLEAIGVTPVNNIVDVTNYVLMECGQPLHAFDFDKLKGQRILVRRARSGESIKAIDQREYALTPDTCVIADAERPVAIGGVMGGFDTEIGDETTNVLIETAAFAPLSIRSTARRLDLHSPSSFRFERSVDRTQLDWASRRCCELIVQIAGGELLHDAVSAGQPPAEDAKPITLRFAQLPRILGIEIPPETAISILESLGLQRVGEATADAAQFLAPSWRRDLAREVDLIEEVARIHGYERIPEDAPLPVVSTARSPRERVLSRIRDTLTAAGFYEAITLTFVSQEQLELFRPRGEQTFQWVDHSSRRRENILRQSLIPSLLECRRENEKHGTFDAQLFEIAKVFLEADPSRRETEVEPMTIGMVSGRSFQELKGVVEALARSVHRRAEITARAADVSGFAPGRGAELFFNGNFWGWMGELDRSVTDALKLRDAAAAVEVSFHVMLEQAELVSHFEPLDQFPAVSRDLNFVLDESINWQDVEQTVREAAGPLLEAVRFGGQYRGKQIADDKKSYVVTLDYRSKDRTLTTEEVDAAQQCVIEACEKSLAAALR